MAKTVGERKKKVNWSVFGFIVFPMTILCRTKKGSWGTGSAGNGHWESSEPKRLLEYWNKCGSPSTADGM